MVEFTTCQWSRRRYDGVTLGASSCCRRRYDGAGTDLPRTPSPSAAKSLFVDDVSDSNGGGRCDIGERVEDYGKNSMEVRWGSWSTRLGI